MSAMTQKRKDQISEEVLKLRREPENLRCVDCNNRNCSYVCTNFSTFLCSDCAGLYRKYCFRVKSCTVATFTEKEYENLKTSGGNEESNRKYMARWKKRTDGPIPKQGDLKGLDDFIHRKYVKKQWFKDKKRKKKTKKKVDQEDEKNHSESKTKSKGSSGSPTGKRSQENQQLESAFLASETGAKDADDEWDPWGEKSNLPTKVAPAVQVPQADFLSDFSFGTMPAVGANKINDNWDPFGSKPSAAAACGPSNAKKPSLDLMTELISDMQVNKPQDNFGRGIMETKKSPRETKPVQQKPKPVYNDPFSTFFNIVPANQPAAKTSPIPQVRAVPQPTQHPPPMHYPMYMNTYAQSYGMAPPVPYAAQYNMAPQQPMHPYGAQMPSNARPMISQHMPYGAQAPAQMNNYGYQLSSFDVSPASQVSQDNPFS